MKIELEITSLEDAQKALFDLATRIVEEFLDPKIKDERFYIMIDIDCEKGESWQLDSFSLRCARVSYVWRRTD